MRWTLTKGSSELLVAGGCAAPTHIARSVAHAVGRLVVEAPEKNAGDASAERSRFATLEVWEVEAELAEGAMTATAHAAMVTCTTFIALDAIPGPALPARDTWTSLHIKHSFTILWARPPAAFDTSALLQHEEITSFDKVRVGEAFSSDAMDDFKNFMATIIQVPAAGNGGRSEEPGVTMHEVAAHSRAPAPPQSQIRGWLQQREYRRMHQAASKVQRRFRFYFRHKDFIKRYEYRMARRIQVTLPRARIQKFCAHVDVTGLCNALDNAT